MFRESLSVSKGMILPNHKPNRTIAYLGNIPGISNCFSNICCCQPCQLGSSSIRHIHIVIPDVFHPSFQQSVFGSKVCVLLILITENNQQNYAKSIQSNNYSNHGVKVLLGRLLVFDFQIDIDVFRISEKYKKRYRADPGPIILQFMVSPLHSRHQS